MASHLVAPEGFVTGRAVGKFNRAVDSTLKALFTLPKNAIVLRVTHHVTVAFDGTTPLVTIGSATDADALATSAEIAPAATGVKVAAAATIAAGALGPLAADTEYVVTFSVTGGTVGTVYTIVEFAVLPSTSL